MCVCVCVYFNLPPSIQWVGGGQQTSAIYRSKKDFEIEMYKSGHCFWSLKFQSASVCVVSLFSI